MKITCDKIQNQSSAISITGIVVVGVVFAVVDVDAIDEA